MLTEKNKIDVLWRGQKALEPGKGRGAKQGRERETREVGKLFLCVICVFNLAYHY